MVGVKGIYGILERVFSKNNKKGLHYFYLHSLLAIDWATGGTRIDWCEVNRVNTCKSTIYMYIGSDMMAFQPSVIYRRHIHVTR